MAYMAFQRGRDLGLGLLSFLFFTVKKLRRSSLAFAGGRQHSWEIRCLQSDTKEILRILWECFFVELIYLYPPFWKGEPRGIAKGENRSHRGEIG